MTGVRLARIRYPVTTLGPGIRLGIWFQGCTIGCRGCLSRDTWDPSGAVEVDIHEALETAASLIDCRISGVTVSGGEPFEQPAALRGLLHGLRDDLGLSKESVDVLCYSGNDEHVLRETFPDILDLLDALIPNPYRAGEPTVDAWRGSSNQPVLLLSDLGRMRFGQGLPSAPGIQVSVEDGRVEIIGVPRRGDLRRVERKLAESGVSLEQVSWRP